MPIIEFIEKTHNTKVLVWKVTETNEELLEYVTLNEERLERFSILSEKRKREFLGIRACMKFLNLDHEILYTENGKPYIPISQNISFTHSYGMVAVAVSDLNIGIDIELTRTKEILNIQHKFIREDEINFISEKLKTDYLHIIWGIKEGLYKLNGGNLWNFLHNYKVDSSELNENPIDCWVLEEEKSNKYHAYYKKIEEYYLVWTLDID